MGKKADAIEAINKWSGRMAGGIDAGVIGKVASPPSEVLDNPDNQLVSKDMAIRALRDDAKAQIAGELELAWSYVAVFAVAAAKLAEGQSGSQTHTDLSLDGDRLEEIFAEYEFKREPFQGGVKLTILRRKDQQPILTIPIKVTKQNSL